jgi:GT2 family glycosyltransferase
MYKASVVILNWNGEKFLKLFLPYLIKYTSHPEIELVVADNASTDSSVDFLKSNFPQIRLIILDKNYGFAGGYNKALEQIQSRYFVLLNSDVEVTENWILPVLDFMDQDETIGACMPKILSYHNRAQFEHAGASGGFIDKNGFPFCRGRVLDYVETDQGQYNNAIPVFWATGACMFVRAEAFHHAGKLDAFFFAHMEEIDLCWRMQWHNYKIFVYPFAQVYHVGGGALPKENPRKTYLNFRNNLFLLFKNIPSGKLFGKLFVRLSLDGLAAVQYLFKLKFSFFWAILKAHFHFYKHLNYLLNFRKEAKYLKNRAKTFTGMEDVNILTNYYLKGCKRFSEIINNR